VLEPVTPKLVAPEAHVESAALRVLLPRQLELAPTLSGIEEKTHRLIIEAGTRELPKYLHATRELLAGIPSVETLASGTRIRQLFTHSGIALEATLARHVLNVTAPVPVSDRKWQLLDLLARVEAPAAAPPSSPLATRQEPFIEPSQQAAAQSVPRQSASTDLDWGIALATFGADLKDKLEGMIAHLSIRQLQSSTATELGQTFGLLEIPVRVGDDHEVLQLQYSRDDGTAQSSDTLPHHSLLVVVPLPGPTQLRVRLTLYAENLSVVAWADDSALIRQLQEHQEMLRSRLAACGFQVERVVVAPVAGPDTEAFLTHSLIDTQI
jgi:hypothetical protein